VELAQEQYQGFLKNGDLEVYEQMFRQLYQPLCNYAYTFVRDRDVAEETVQNTFLNLWEKRESLSVQQSVKSYMYTMVRNACLNVLKHNKIKLKHADEVMATEHEGYESVAQTVLHTELQQKILDAMMALPEQCRLVFKLSRFEELKYQEIADQLGISIKTVENQMSKALRIMREQLRDYLPLIFIVFKGLLE